MDVASVGTVVGIYLGWSLGLTWEPLSMEWKVQECRYGPYVDIVCYPASVLLNNIT